MNKIIRSPFFYVGDKCKIINQIRKYFPIQIDTLYDPFVGGGSVFLNVEANNYILNDIDNNIIELHKFLCSYVNREDELFSLFNKIIDDYNLSCSYRIDKIPNEFKKKFKKSYFAEFNKLNYNRLRDDFNNSLIKDYAKLYLLLIYGFNRILRVNKKGMYNTSVGNVDFNINVIRSLYDYLKLIREKSIVFDNLDFKDFLRNREYNENDLVYCDPPYLITSSQYVKLWSIEHEKCLLSMLDLLNSQNVKFALSNVIEYRGKKNTLLLEWSKKYNTQSIDSNYISFRDNKAKQIVEVLVTNY